MAVAKITAGRGLDLTTHARRPSRCGEVIAVEEPAARAELKLTVAG